MEPFTARVCDFEFTMNVSMTLPGFAHPAGLPSTASGGCRRDKTRTGRLSALREETLPSGRLYIIHAHVRP